MKNIPPVLCFLLSSLLFFPFNFVAADLHNVKHNGMRNPPLDPARARKTCHREGIYYVCNVPIPGPRRGVPIPTPPPVNELIPAAVNDPGVYNPAARCPIPCPRGSSYTKCIAIAKGSPCPCD